MSSAAESMAWVSGFEPNQGPIPVALFARAMDASRHGFFIMNDRGSSVQMTYANPAFFELMNLSASNGINVTPESVFAELELPLLQEIQLAIKDRKTLTLIIQNLNSQGQKTSHELTLAPLFDHSNQSCNFIGTYQDVSERQLVEDQLVKQATHDTLTNLPNRSLLIDRVEQAIKECEKNGKLLSLIFLDLDHFKQINDNLGHNIGDKLLLAVTNRLMMSSREEDTVSRLSGDEFVILLPNLNSEEEATLIADRLLQNIHRPFQIEEHEINVSASIGLSFYPKNGDNYHTLLKNADLSMYYAKNSGRNNFQTFDERMIEHVQGFVQLEQGLRGALSNCEIGIHYQPVISLHTNEIHGTEALMRWHHPKLGDVSPLKFIPVAEELDLISDLSEWLLDSACRQQWKWFQEFNKPMSLSVNLSGKQIQQVNFLDTIKAILTNTELPPEMLDLELTESLLIESMDETLHCMHELKKLGVTITIDDFGTGYSSLSYLKKFPVDNLKIDRSFIQSIETDLENRDILKTIINLAHRLKLCVIAEGIETEQQLKYLLDFECDYAQGFYFHKPMKASDLHEVLKKI